jgi:NAD(P)-dependent dehydrogenase (short-subunit alcohol dehydrogenase family)
VPDYAASKGGVGQLAKAFATNGQPGTFRSMPLSPGYIATDNTEASRNDPSRAESILARIPRAAGAGPEDFAGPAVFLASAASDYVSGTILTVDGGWMGR